MVQSLASQRHTFKLALLADPENVYVEMGLDQGLQPAQMMTSLLFAKDYLKEMTGLSDIILMFDEEMPTSAEEILEQKLEMVFVKPKEKTEEMKEAAEKTASMYVNAKGQLIKVVQQEKNGRTVQMQQILSFDIEKLPQATMHKYTAPAASSTLTNVQRAKVPVKDGRSQAQFIKQSAQKERLVDDPNSVFYTAEEVAEHSTENDCWTIHEGRVYDVTQYAKVHPGGKKIFLGAGKDCTDLFMQYHPWVNTAYLIGKYQVGILKR